MGLCGISPILWTIVWLMAFASVSVVIRLMFFSPLNPSWHKTLFHLFSGAAVHMTAWDPNLNPHGRKI